MNKNTILIAFLPAFMLGCGDSPNSEALKVEKNVAPEMAEKAEVGIAWTLPEGWVEKGSSGMRLASFGTTTPNSTVDVSVIQLGGDGGGVGPNINRWRGQIGLAPATPEELEKSLQKSTCALGEIQWVRLEATSPEQQGFLAAMIANGSGTLYVKLMAPTQELASLEVSFLAFCTSLKAK